MQRVKIQNWESKYKAYTSHRRTFYCYFIHRMISSTEANRICLLYADLLQSILVEKIGEFYFSNLPFFTIEFAFTNRKYL